MEAVVSITFPLASIVIVLYLLWNDLLRRRKTFRALLFARAFLCLALGAVLIYNWISFRASVPDMPIVFVVIASIVSFSAAIWFAYRGFRGARPVAPPREEPLPRIFSSNEDDRPAGSSPDETR